MATVIDDRSGWPKSLAIAANKKHMPGGKDHDQSTHGNRGESDPLVERIKGDGGFTYQPANKTSPTRGYSIAVYPESEVVIQSMDDLSPEKIFDFMQSNMESFKGDERIHFGAWYNHEKTEDNPNPDFKIYLDMSLVLDDLDEATKLAKSKGQLGIFDLANFKTIETLTPDERKEWERKNGKQAKSYDGQTRNVIGGNASGGDRYVRGNRGQAANGRTASGTGSESESIQGRYAGWPESLVLAAQRKHGSHDQKDHGNRDGASGSGGGFTGTPKAGDSFTAKAYGLKPEMTFTIKKIENEDAVVSNGYMTASVPVESLEQLYSDTTGDYSYLSQWGESRSDEVNKVIAGKAKFMGKGADGVVHDVGDGKVVKSSTTVPYHPVGGGRHLTQHEALESFKAKVMLEKEMLGIPGVMETKNGMHGNKIFSIRRKVDTETPLNDKQKDQLIQSVQAMHENGYAINDDIQVGIGDDGNVYHFDLGQASRDASSEDKKLDLDRLNQFLESNGKSQSIRKRFRVGGRLGVTKSMTGDKWASKLDALHERRGEPMETIAAGLAVMAKDTGRLLLLQRALDDEDAASGKPGLYVATVVMSEDWVSHVVSEWQRATRLIIPPECEFRLSIFDEIKCVLCVVSKESEIVESGNV